MFLLSSAIGFLYIIYIWSGRSEVKVKNCKEIMQNSTIKEYIHSVDVTLLKTFLKLLVILIRHDTTKKVPFLIQSPDQVIKSLYCEFSCSFLFFHSLFSKFPNISDFLPLAIVFCWLLGLRLIPSIDPLG